MFFREALVAKDFYPTYTEARAAARALKIKSARDYSKRHHLDPRLPGKPWELYKKDWDAQGGWSGFHGQNRKSRKLRKTYKTWEKASAAAQKLKITTRIEYLLNYEKDKLLPSQPEREYRPVWRKNGGWPAFLGRSEKYRHRHKVYQSFEAASAAAKRLGIRTSIEYRKKYKKDPRLPSRPYFVYEDWKEKGAWYGFLGNEEPKRDYYPTWEEASSAARELNIRGYIEYCKRHKEDPRLPPAPHKRYEGVWTERDGYPGFLGTERKTLQPKTKTFYPTWEEASEAAKSLSINSSPDYQGGAYKKDAFLPSRPEIVYKDVWRVNGGWYGFLGNPIPAEKYKTWSEAAEAARAIGITSYPEYCRRYGEDECLPANPDKVYRKDWIRFGRWKGFFDPVFATKHAEEHRQQQVTQKRLKEALTEAIESCT